MLDHEPGSGLELLPPPDGGDVFFDMEGDPMYAPERGLEYLFGVYLPAEDEYRGIWARNDTEEKRAFEELIDLLVARRARYPQMHVYHYAPYETTALRRLMGRYATREAELDDLLRNQVFVDLYAVTRQALRISQPSYSIKKLEAFYGMRRNAAVTRGDDSIVQFEAWLASRDDEILRQIGVYNEEDCRSTYLLREWLIELRRRAGACSSRAASSIWRSAEPSAEGSGDRLVAASVQRRRLFGCALDEPRRWRELRELARRRAREGAGCWVTSWSITGAKRSPASGNSTTALRIATASRNSITKPSEGCACATRSRRASSNRTIVTSCSPTSFPTSSTIWGPPSRSAPEAKIEAGDLVSIDDDRNVLEIKLSGKLVPRRSCAPSFRGNRSATNDLQREALRRVAEAYAGELARNRISGRQPTIS